MNYDKRRYLEQLRKEFYADAPFFKTLIDQVLEDGATRYPILIAHRSPINLGLALLDADVRNTFWHFRVSPLEELVKKGLVSRDQARQFKLKYENPREKACILFVPPEVPDDAGFVFIPFSSELPTELFNPGVN